ncbi:MAG: cytochrome c [Verrucomicrobia bacterium]|nr:cytochrome c [Verrucomicrobiota bacterium]
MNRPFHPILLAALLLGIAAHGISGEVPVEPLKNPFAGDAWKLPTNQVTLKNAPGLELIQANCVMCHSLDYVSMQPPLTRAQWTAGVDKMRVRFGAPLTTNQIPAIVDYLEANYAPKKP